MRHRSLSISCTSGFLAVLLCLGASPVLAQRGRQAASPVQSNTRYPTKTQPQVIQKGISEPTAPKSQSNSPLPNDGCQQPPNRGYSPSNSPYRVNSAGYPQYPGPKAPLPTPGTYYVNPYGYYNSPYAPHDGGYNIGGSNNGSYNNSPNPFYRGSHGTEQRR